MTFLEAVAAATVDVVALTLAEFFALYAFMHHAFVTFVLSSKVAHP